MCPLFAYVFYVLHICLFPHIICWMGQVFLSTHIYVCQKYVFGTVFIFKPHICHRPNFPIFVETLVVMCVTHRKSECVESLETQVGRTHFLLAPQGHQMFTCIHTKIHKNYNIHTIHTNGHTTTLKLEKYYMIIPNCEIDPYEL